MNVGTQLGLVLAYLLPTALVAWLLTEVLNRQRRTAIVLLLMLPLFYIGHYLLLGQLQGWPSTSRLPDSFRLIAYEASEPDQRTGDRGRILMWLQADDSPMPRVHMVEYDPELHRRLGEAAEQKSAGKPQRGELRPTEDAESTTSEVGNEASRLFFRDDSRRLLPPKT